jgi:hypothetical protein
LADKPLRNSLVRILQSGRPCAKTSAER